MAKKSLTENSSNKIHYSFAVSKKRFLFTLTKNFRVTRKNSCCQMLFFEINSVCGKKTIEKLKQSQFRTVNIHSEQENAFVVANQLCVQTRLIFPKKFKTEMMDHCRPHGLCR